MTMNLQEFLDYIREAKSKSTFKNYRQGIRKFVEWYGKDADTILKERFEDLKSTEQKTRRRFNREIEKFHRHLKNVGHPQNTAVAYTEGIRALFRFYDMDIKDLPTEVTRKVTTTKDFIPSVRQYRDMFNCGTLLDRIIISQGLDLAWRIGDFLNQKKEHLPNLDEQTPIPYDLITQKEEVISKSFVSEQTAQLLKTYLKTLPEDNPYLFPNGKGGHLKDESINKRLRQLAKKTKIKVPKGKRLRFHAFRKRFLSECANLKIDINTAKILCGKSVSKDMLAYLSEVEHKKAFEEVHARLRVTAQPETKALLTVKQSEIEALKKRIEELEILNRGLVEMLRQAKTMTPIVKEGKISFIPAKEFALPFEEFIIKTKALGKKAIEREQAEYKKLIEENNNNHS